MEILRGNDPSNFQVRGRHTTVYPVALPAFLPIDVVRGLVKRYRLILLSELQVMMSREQRKVAKQDEIRHVRNLSRQSDAGLSVSSDKSGKHLMPVAGSHGL